MKLVPKTVKEIEATINWILRVTQHEVIGKKGLGLSSIAEGQLRIDALLFEMERRME